MAFAGRRSHAPFRSRIREELHQRTQAFGELAVEMYARAFSTRNIKSVLRVDAGQSMLSRTALSEVTERLWTESGSFATRDFAEFRPQNRPDEGARPPSSPRVFGNP